jgi:hypothetical protein
MKLVPNASKAWKWFSMRILAITAALQLAWETLPPEALALFSPDWRGYITLGLILLAMFGRMIDQETAK